MMKTSVYVTNASVGKGTGGGIVAYNEISALQSVTELTQVLSFKDINPTSWKLPDNPFLLDYMAAYLLQNTKVDLAHLYGGPFTLTVQKLKSNGAKVFVTIAAHNIELSIEEHHRLGLNYPYFHMSNPYLWRIYSQYIREADVVIFPSKLSAEYMANKIDLQNEIVIIPHGCDLPREVRPLPETLTVAHVGVNGPDKGQIYLVKAWIEHLKFIKEKLLIAGEGTQNWGLGYVQDVNQIYEQSSVYVQPSVTEAFGIPVLEAMAHGRPVIVSRGAGVHEIIEDGKEGFIVPIRSPKDIADRILYFRDNPSEVKRMGANARTKAEQYSWDKIRKLYEELYVEGC